MATVDSLQCGVILFDGATSAWKISLTDLHKGGMLSRRNVRLSAFAFVVRYSIEERCTLPTMTCTMS